MAVVSTFFGIVVRMCHADHPPPHLNASYQGLVAFLRIADGTIIHGKLPIKAARIVPQWALDHHDAAHSLHARMEEAGVLVRRAA